MKMNGTGHRKGMYQGFDIFQFIAIPDNMERHLNGSVIGCHTLDEPVETMPATDISHKKDIKFLGGVGREFSYSDGSYRKTVRDGNVREVYGRITCVSSSG